MTLAYDDGQARFYIGDVREELRALPERSVHMCVTSPPYWGLRDYGTATWDGGDAECDHADRPARNDVTAERLAERAAAYGTGTGAGSKVTTIQYRSSCGKCGAVRQDRQLGLEETPAEYIANMVSVFREVKRVLRDDATLWLNIGDSYATRWGSTRNQGRGGFIDNDRGRSGATPRWLKEKDLVGIPWMLAFALRDDGWYLRSDIIWHKPNPMPESVTDRPTKAHEYLFLLTKKATYFYDATAIAERSLNEGVTIKTNGNDGMDAGYDGHRSRDGFRRGVTVGATRNKRSVWTIATEAYPDAHFATFPTALVRPCILAGTSEKGVCAACGSPWQRTTEIDDPNGRLGASFNDHVDDLARGHRGVPRAEGAPIKRTTGWERTCDCANDPDPVPATVLDPFLGSGTTAIVAKELGRHAVGIDLNAEYIDLARQRCAQMGLFL